MRDCEKSCSKKHVERKMRTKCCTGGLLGPPSNLRNRAFASTKPSVPHFQPYLPKPSTWFPWAPPWEKMSSKEPVKNTCKNQYKCSCLGVPKWTPKWRTRNTIFASGCHCDLRWPPGGQKGQQMSETRPHNFVTTACVHAAWHE